MPPTVSKQTISFLKKRFEEAGISINPRHGQNFLIDLNLMRMLVSTADIGPDDVVLEVGAGTGSLTAMMAACAAAVISVEIDERMHQLASEELIDFENVTLLHQDALRNKNALDERVLDAVRQQLNAAPGRKFKLVANLPYCVATPVISNLLMQAPVPESMTVTIQKELADRIVASPGSKDYSALSFWIQAQCQSEIVRLLAPTVFWPRPKVTSAILHIKLDTERRALVPDLKFYHEFVRKLFCHRRKFLRSVVVSITKPDLSKPQVDEVMQELCFDENTRAEQLSIPQMIALAEAVRRRLPAAV